MLSLFIRHLHFCNKKCPTEKQSVSKTTVFNKAFIYFKFKDLKVCSFQTLWLYFTIGVFECRILTWMGIRRKHHILVEILKWWVIEKVGTRGPNLKHYKFMYWLIHSSRNFICFSVWNQCSPSCIIVSVALILLAKPEIVS